MSEQPAFPTEECDLVMKGGITSGVVYPYAILELAQRYRFRSIGGASAGAIAAAFAAAAEYGRQNGDAAAFMRFKSRSEEIPDLLGKLFQPSAPFARLMNAALAWTGEKKGRVGRVGWALKAPLYAGAAAGLTVFGLLAFLPLAFSWSPGSILLAVLGAILAAVIGALGLLVVYVGRLVLKDLPDHQFGLCSGAGREKGMPPALTGWIHESLQFIAFGAAGRAKPLTFRDLAEVGLSAEEIAKEVKAIDLRMMTTNLSMARPHAIPDFDLDLLFAPSAWRRLFPADVMTYLESAVCPTHPGDAGFRKAPKDGDLPVVVGVRMSLSFPILIEAVPMHIEDVGARVREEIPKNAPLPIRKLLFSDGGITSNFPIHFFDALLPARPTFALSLDPMDSPDLDRVSLPKLASDGAFSPIRTVEGTGGFAGAILNAAKDWQDEMLSVLPGQRQRVVRIRLKKDEGGLNLNMPTKLSRELMGFGQIAGARIRTEFDFPDHQYRRTIVAYWHLKHLSEGFGRVWPTYGVQYRAYAPTATSYKTRVKPPARLAIADHLDAFAKSPQSFQPPLPGTVKFPQPTGRLSIVPEV